MKLSDSRLKISQSTINVHWVPGSREMGEQRILFSGSRNVPEEHCREVTFHVLLGWGSLEE